MQPRCCTLKRVRDRLGFTDASNLFAHHRSHCGRRPIDDGATGRRETIERSRRSFPTAAGGPSSRRRCVASLGQNALASFGQNAPLSPLVPSPSRSRLKCRTRASPGGEGAVTSTALAVRSHDVKQPISFPRRVFAPGVCIVASLTRIEGWAERRETFGCVRGTRGAYHMRHRRCVP